MALSVWHGLKRIARGVRRFGGDRRGNVAMMFGFLAIPLIALAGAAVDYSNALRLKSKLQSALDATALAVARDGGEMSAAEVTDLANNFFSANLTGGELSNMGELVVDQEDGTVKLSVGGDSITSFIAIMGFHEIPVSVSTEVLVENQTFEIALVLDNSGSMAGSKITSLRDATTALVNSLWGETEDNPNLSFSLVPFTSAVNVGTGNKNASWMDVDGESDLHHPPDVFSDDSLTRYEIYDRITNVDWPGCVEARAHPMDVNDAPADPANPNTLFVPYFYPDEPGDSGDPQGNGSNSGFWNSYLDDEMGGTSTSELRARQRNIDKYDAGSWAGPSELSSSYGRGPAMLCNSRPILPLANTKQLVLDAVDDMEANGGTNITEGLMWGWRTLSPAQPFTEGRDYNDVANRKIIILLTDGSNDWAPASNFNRSYYLPWGYISQGRLGITSGSKSQIIARMNDRLEEACENVDGSGIRVYSITFGSLDSDTTDLMRNCATQDNLYYHAPDSDDIAAAFEAIAADIKNLRIIK